MTAIKLSKGGKSGGRLRKAFISRRTYIGQVADHNYMRLVRYALREIAVFEGL